MDFEKVYKSLIDHDRIVISEIELAQGKIKELESRLAEAEEDYSDEREYRQEITLIATEHEKRISQLEEVLIDFADSWIQEIDDPTIKYKDLIKEIKEKRGE